ncbi:hypothetical protein [Sphingorhabdus sp.]|jgi:hypothetical protein|uniref:hypothetical protein n=1 Tax=Sphingorhabdus sp. TaxID=1902408 RepID=UPI003BAFDD73|nr:hypothetical protein [Sphingomonadales bacterium]MBL0021795.1 hypothetical protein [Sphingomonadales bacterium]
MRWNAIFVCLVLSGCGQDGSGTVFSSDSSAELDRQAIAKDLLPDPETLNMAGRYERRSELGTDKFCATKNGSQHDIGILAVFGPESKCEAQGSATADSSHIRITLKGKESCSFTAEFDGVALRIPGTLDSGCSSYCSPRASLSGTSYYFVEQGDVNARKALGRDFEKLCP